MPNTGYSYHWPRSSNQMLKDLSFNCPVCGEGETWTVTLDMDGNERGTPEFDCEASPACERAYTEGRYGDALHNAIAAADRIEANGPTESQLESIYDTAGPSDADSVQRMADARKLR